MSAYEWEPADNGERVQALWDLEDYYCGRFGECEKRRVDGSLCGLFRDARGRCGAESQHV